MKRIFDLLVVLVLLVPLFPLALFAALLLWMSVGRPVIFVQKRPGLKGQPFYLYKFRTMLNTRDASGKLLPDADRMTAVGRWVRAASLDELPQLLNVLKGDMSLVGPRPLLMEYLPLYTSEEMRRHEVRPGITGWAQVNGRNALTWKEKFRLDLWYVENRSFWLDLRILLMTVSKVLKRQGVSKQGMATTEAYNGTN